MKPGTTLTELRGRLSLLSLRRRAQLRLSRRLQRQADTAFREAARLDHRVRQVDLDIAQLRAERAKVRS